MNIDEGLVSALRRYSGSDVIRGALMLVASCVALFWANSPFSDSYFHLWNEFTVSISFGDIGVSKTLQEWVNEGLMVLFFLSVGLEIKRELTTGKLSEGSQAVLPLIAALGGMLAPALIYLAFNYGTKTENGWGVPIATDIAFALAILGAVKGGIAGARLFLVSLAVADDIGAILVIALFYSHEMVWHWIGIAAGLAVLVFAANRLRIHLRSVYAILGFGIWLALLGSGVHPTLAGVLLGLLMPNRGVTAESMQQLVSDELKSLEDRENGTAHDSARRIRRKALKAISPVRHFEDRVEGVVYLLVLPLFALANAGIRVSMDEAIKTLSDPVGLGIILGLLLGKTVAIFGSTWLAVRAGIAALPGDLRWRLVLGVASIGGVGFTMALFIARLAFSDEAVLQTAKMAILIASVLAGILGVVLLLSTPGVTEGPDASGDRE